MRNSVSAARKRKEETDSRDKLWSAEEDSDGESGDIQIRKKLQPIPANEFAVARDLNQHPESVSSKEIPHRNTVGPQQNSASQRDGIQSVLSAQSSNLLAPQFQGCTFTNLTMTTNIMHASSPSDSRAEDKCNQLQENFKNKLRNKYRFLFEGVPKHGMPSLLADVYTELYITEGGVGKVNTEHEVRQIETTSRKPATKEHLIKIRDIFRSCPENAPRTVVTKGIAGIGKTVSVQKFILDWAEGRANTDLEFIFPFPFRELNLLMDKEFSLLGLTQHYHPEMKGTESFHSNSSNVAFILDGLDECRLPLNFASNPGWYDVTVPTSVDVLLTNLIKGNLLPSSLLWITTRPAAVHLIPADCVHRVSEIRGFNDEQKEDYFMKKFDKSKLASSVISHIKSVRSLYIMCHIPVFCWISASVLESVLSNKEVSKLPKTLTQMYTYFLLIQISRNQKYKDAIKEKNTEEMQESDRKMILNLGHLAFQGVKEGKLIFYENDLIDFNINVIDASVFSGMLTEIFQEECGLLGDKIYSFVHLTVQEYLAALYMICKDYPGDDEKEVGFHFIDDKVMHEEEHAKRLFIRYKDFLEEAINSKNGHLDLYLRFVLGLLLNSNRSLLKNLLKLPKNTFTIINEMVTLINKKIKGNLPSERTINLFHCLSELNDNSLVKNMEFSLKSGSLCQEYLTPAQCSALAYIVLMSENVLEHFDLKMYNTSKTGKKRLLPIMKISKAARLSNCDLKGKCCPIVSSALMFSYLNELDISNNHLGDRGAILLCKGLSSQQCKLQVLNISNCELTELGVRWLFSAMKNQYCEIQALDISRNNLGPSALIPLEGVLRLSHNKLQTLNLSHNNLQDSGMKDFCVALDCPYGRLRTVDFSGNNLGKLGVEILCNTLEFSSGELQALYLNCNKIGDGAVKLLCAKLLRPCSKFHTLGLRECNLTGLCCEHLATAIRSVSSELRSLELRDNDLQNLGVMHLSAAAGDPNCKLQTLDLSACCITEDGFLSLASTLQSNLSHLKELDLSYNHPGASGLAQLSDRLQDPQCCLEKLTIDHGGEKRNKAGLWKYGCSLSLGSCTAKGTLSISEGNQKVTLEKEDLTNPKMQEGSDNIHHVVCNESFARGRCYWEVEWEGSVGVGVACRELCGKLDSDSSILLESDKSWFLICNDDIKGDDNDSKCISTEVYDEKSDDDVHGFGNDEDGDDYDEEDEFFDTGDDLHVIDKPGYLAIHKKKVTNLLARASNTCKIGLYLDWPIGTLSFYRVLPDEVSHLYTFTAKFTEEVCPVFLLFKGLSSVSLYQPQENSVS